MTDDQPWLQERIDHPLGGGKHTFTISVTIRGDGADYEGRLTTVQEKAYSLRDALRQAFERPLDDWFADDRKEMVEEAHEEALEQQENCWHLRQTDVAADVPLSEPMWVCDTCGWRSPVDWKPGAPV